MSALGHKRTFRTAIGMSAFPPKADIPWCLKNCPLWAIGGHLVFDGVGKPPRIRPSPRTDTSLYRRSASEHLLRPLSLVAPAVEAPLPPDPHLVVSGELCVHREIRAHRGV